MGLDLVEYVIAVEHAFEINFDDSEVERTTTVGEFHQLVLKELRAKYPWPDTGRARQQVCVSSRVFYRLRKALVGCGFAARNAITPKTELVSLIPRDGRRARWDQLSDAVKCTLPPLEHTIWLCYSLLVISILLTIWPIMSGHVYVGWQVVLWLICGVTGFFILAKKLLQPLAVEFPRDRQTVGSLVEWVTANHWSLFAEPNREWTDREVWETIRRLLVEHQGLEPEMITPDKSFVHDLGMD